MSDPSETGSKPKRPWTKTDRVRRIRRANIGKMKRRCLTVLTRDIEKLLEHSHGNRLEPAEGKMLLEYLKYINEIEALAELEKLGK